ncbi:MAG: hypothetical protein LIO65_00145 [Odoribacter sp.]|nr:hypothetical protein [Odoribacter sp.]
MKEYQVTLFCITGEYRPVSCIVKNAATEVTSALKSELRTQGVVKICQKRGWSSSDLKRFHYTKVAIREYDKEKIEREKAERYEQIKKERGWS